MQPFPSEKNHFLGQLKATHLPCGRAIPLGNVQPFLGQLACNTFALGKSHFLRHTQPFFQTIQNTCTRKIHFAIISQGLTTLFPWMKPIWDKDRDGIRV